MRIQLLVALAVASLAAGSAVCQEKRQLGAHVHGRTQLLLAVDGATISIELHAPGMDIVGFEHEAAKSDDKAMVDAAVANLTKGDELFVFDAAAGCRLGLAVAGLVEGEHVHDHAESEKHDHAPGETHTEFEAVYEFVCARPAAIASLGTRFFAAFPRAGVVELKAVGRRSAIAAELTRAQPVADLRGAF
jgi:hypothetical protein